MPHQAKSPLACGVCAIAGTSYPDFIHSLHLPEQLAEVDPIVASFCGGAVGAVSALLVVEVSTGWRPLPYLLLGCVGVCGGLAWAVVCAVWCAHVCALCALTSGTNTLLVDAGALPVMRHVQMQCARTMLW